MVSEVFSHQANQGDKPTLSTEKIPMLKNTFNDRRRNVLRMSSHHSEAQYRFCKEDQWQQLGLMWTSWNFSWSHVLITSCTQLKAWQESVTLSVKPYRVRLLCWTCCVLEENRQRGWVFRSSDLKSGDPEFKSRSDHLLDLFQVVLGSTPRLWLYIANWFASCQVGFLTCWVYFSCLFHWPWKALVGSGQWSMYVYLYVLPVHQ